MRACVAGVVSSLVVVAVSTCCIAVLVLAVLIAYMAALRAHPCATPQLVCILWVVPVLSRQRVVEGRAYQLCTVGASDGQFAVTALIKCCRGSEGKALVMSR